MVMFGHIDCPKCGCRHPESDDCQARKAERAESARNVTVEDKTPTITFIMFKRRGKFKLAACRGGRKGCNVDLKARSKIGPCEFCVVAEDEQETIGDFQKRLERGDS